MDDFSFGSADFSAVADSQACLAEWIWFTWNAFEALLDSNRISAPLRIIFIIANFVSKMGNALGVVAVSCQLPVLLVVHYLSLWSWLWKLATTTTTVIFALWVEDLICHFDCRSAFPPKRSRLKCLPQLVTQSVRDPRLNPLT